MGAIKVHGNIVSPAVMRVLGCLHEKDLQPELVPVDMAKGAHQKEPFLSLSVSTNGFEDGDLKLFESRAVNQYIVHAYGEKGNQLSFEDSKKMAAVYVWMEVEAQKFDPASAKLVFELCVKPFLGMATDDAAVEEYEGKLGQVLDVYEARLEQSKYLAADSFTLADLNHLPCLNNLMGTKSRKVLDARPHVSAWCADILARPAWTKVVEMQKKQP